MRLLSCHVIGFGKLVNERFDFSQRTVFQKENGWGKTTLCAFLECMLYGMDVGRSKNVQQNPRIKYEPWSGARFGGVLTFTYQSETFRVERFFGKTPALDVTKIYDKNDMPCYAFGDKGERLGETLLGVDRESFQRSVFIAQEKENGAISDGLKARLLSLLSVAPTDNGAQGAVERLDEAERALRAKRRPAKGKLDEVDERLFYLEEQKTQCRRAGERAEALRKELAEQANRLDEIKKQLKYTEGVLASQRRYAEKQAAREAYAEWKNKFSQTQRALEEATAFFNGNEPATVNVDGLQTAVNEYYALKEEVGVLQARLEEVETQLREKENLEMQLTACEKTLDSYDVLLQEQTQTAGAGKPVEKKNDQRRRTKRRFTALLFSILAVFVGAMLVATLPRVGYTLLIGGVLVFLWSARKLVKSAGGKQKTKLQKRTAFADAEVEARYQAVLAERETLKSKLSVFSPQLTQTQQSFVSSIESKQNRANALDNAIRNFLNNFRFIEIYDYRASLAQLREKITFVLGLQEECKTYEQKVKTYKEDSEEESEYVDANPQELTQKKSALESERVALETARGRTLATLEQEEKTAFAIYDLQAEEERLTEEKERLERRLTAIRAAKEFLLRARENMAKRYLEPVEKLLCEYLQTLGFSNAPKLRFSGAGAPLVEENGVLCAQAYYSAGLQDLLCFCQRIALAQTIFGEEDTPPLILDDPFANLDDKRLEKAKSFVKKLAEKYQIIYFTCHSERAL